MTLLVATSSSNLATADGVTDRGQGWASHYWLTPDKWDYHRPWFWNIGDGLENDQWIKDAEIQMMYANGIDCVANLFCTHSYPRPPEFDAYTRIYFGDAGDGQNRDLMLHLTSPYRHLMKYCIFVLNCHGTWGPQVAYLVQRFLDNDYQKVLGSRPLLYMFFPEDMFVTLEGRSISQAAADIATLRTATVAAGLGTPYIVGLDTNPTGAGNLYRMTTLGLDCASMYTTWPNASPEAYASYAAREETGWNTTRDTLGHDVSPWVSAGIDYRMQSDVNGLAGSTSPPGAGEALPGPWSAIPTPAQFSQHLQNAMAWDHDHNPADIVTIYSWKEWTECARPLSPLHSDMANNGGDMFLQRAIAQALGRQRDSKAALRSRGIAITSR